MKTTKTFEIEIQRHNVTPAQFLAYLRSMQKKHPEMSNDFNLDQFAAEGWNASYTNALPSEKPCNAERVTDKPYEKQTYIRNFDGTTYNEIIEFQFDDDKTGHGYYYTVQIDVADEDREANTAETIAHTIANRARKAEAQEARAAKLEAEADEAEARGYTAQWWIESQRTEAASLRREAAATREAITASTTQTAAEAPQTADEIQTTDNTASVMKAAEKARQSRYSARQTAPLTFAIWDNVKNAPAIETTATGITAYMEIFASSSSIAILIWYTFFIGHPIFSSSRSTKSVTRLILSIVAGSFSSLMPLSHNPYVIGVYRFRIHHCAGDNAGSGT